MKKIINKDEDVMVKESEDNYFNDDYKMESKPTKDSE